MLEPAAGRTAAELDLSSAEVTGEPAISLTTNLDLRGIVLEVKTPDGWRPLGDRPVTVPWPGAPHRLPVRLLTGRCAAESTAGDDWVIRVSGATGDRQVRREVPLRVVVTAAPWLRCWWPALALVAGVLLVAVVVHGIVSPSRFPARLGILLSPEEDPNEGFFHPIRAQRGSGSGFYRDARVVISPDFRISGSAAGALVRLRADHNQVKVQPMSGSGLLRRSADDTWESLPGEETSMRFGVLCCDEMQTIFFELRNG